jgi:hypothetical protein
MDDQPAKHRIRRPWLRFSLATLLVVVSAVGIWLGAKANRAQRQARIVQRVTELGGTISYDYEAQGSSHASYPAWFRALLPHDYLADVHAVRLPNSAVSDDDLALLSELSGIVFLDLTGTKITDDGLRHIGRMKQLKVLILNDTAVSDVGVKSLGYLHEMGILELNHTGVTDEGLAVVRGMPLLGSLFLQGTSISDEGLDNLQGLDYLSNLDITRTHATDKSLATLGKLPMMWTLFVSCDVLTPEGIDELRKFPKLTRVFYERDENWRQTQELLKRELPNIGFAPHSSPQRERP